jgi:ribosomal protein L9
MFGSVTENDIAQALKQLDIDIHRSAIQLEHHYQRTGRAQRRYSFA